MKIRADDPTSMKNFIVSVQKTTNDLKASSRDDHEKKNSKRVSLLCFIIRKVPLVFSGSLALITW